MAQGGVWFGGFAYLHLTYILPSGTCSIVQFNHPPVRLFCPRGPRHGQHHPEGVAAPQAPGQGGGQEGQIAPVVSACWGGGGEHWHL